MFTGATTRSSEKRDAQSCHWVDLDHSCPGRGKRDGDCLLRLCAPAPSGNVVRTSREPGAGGARYHHGDETAVCDGRRYRSVGGRSLRGPLPSASRRAVTLPRCHTRRVKPANDPIRRLRRRPPRGDRLYGGRPLFAAAVRPLPHRSPCAGLNAAVNSRSNSRIHRCAFRLSFRLVQLVK